MKRLLLLLLPLLISPVFCLGHSVNVTANVIGESGVILKSFVGVGVGISFLGFALSMLSPRISTDYIFEMIGLAIGVVIIVSVFSII